jgi:hypothetical protein
MAMRRRWFLLFGVFVVAVLVAGWLLVPVSEGRISRASCENIQLGWTAKQVDVLLGEERLSGASGWGFRTVMWDDEEGNVIMVSFSESSGVTSKSFTPTEKPIWDRIKLQIRRRLRAMWP